MLQYWSSIHSCMLLIILIALGIAFYFYNKNKSAVNTIAAPLIEKLHKRKKLLLIIFVPIDLILLANLKNPAMGIMVFALNLAVAYYYFPGLYGSINNKLSLSNVDFKKHKITVLLVAAISLYFAYASMKEAGVLNFDKGKVIRGESNSYTYGGRPFYKCPNGYSGGGTEPFCYKK